MHMKNDRNNFINHNNVHIHSEQVLFSVNKKSEIYILDVLRLPVKSV